MIELHRVSNASASRPAKIVLDSSSDQKRLGPRFRSQLRIECRTSSKYTINIIEHVSKSDIFPSWKPKWFLNYFNSSFLGLNWLCQLYLVNVGLIDDEEDVLGLPDGHSRHSSDLYGSNWNHSTKWLESFHERNRALRSVRHLLSQLPLYTYYIQHTYRRTLEKL